MCFSMTASMTASAVLIPIGIYSMTSALRRHRTYLFFSAFPLFFGVQQFIEGVVWYGLHQSNNALVHSASLLYLFFAFFWWPFYFPFSVYYIEKNPDTKKTLLLITVVGFIFGAILYSPILFNFVPLVTTIVNQSIKYLTFQPEYILVCYGVVYIAIVIFSLWLSSVKTVKIFGTLIALAAIVSFLLYLLVFVSMWCFFSALLSAYIAYVVRTA